MEKFKQPLNNGKQYISSADIAECESKYMESDRGYFKF